MLDEVNEIMYSKDDCIMDRFREKDYELMEDEKRILNDFALEVNKKLKENKMEAAEICLALDIVYSFMYVEELHNFTAGFFQNIVKNVRY